MPLNLLLFGAVFSSVAKVFSVYLVTNGRMAYNVLSVTAGVLVTVALDVILIPLYGINGAAIATSVSYFTIFVVLLLVLKFEMKIDGMNYFFPDRGDLVRIVERLKFW